MPLNNVEINFEANCLKEPVATRLKKSRILSLLGMLLTGVLVVTSAAMALEVGEQAPEFTLPSTSGEKFSLSQFQGKKHVLIQFYTMDFQPT